MFTHIHTHKVTEFAKRMLSHIVNLLTLIIHTLQTAIAWHYRIPTYANRWEKVRLWNWMCVKDSFLQIRSHNTIHQYFVFFTRYFSGRKIAHGWQEHSFVLTWIYFVFTVRSIRINLIVLLECLNISHKCST